MSVVASWWCDSTSRPPRKATSRCWLGCGGRGAAAEWKGHAQAAAGESWRVGLARTPGHAWLSEVPLNSRPPDVNPTPCNNPPPSLQSRGRARMQNSVLILMVQTELPEELEVGG